MGPIVALTSLAPAPHLSYNKTNVVSAVFLIPYAGLEITYPAYPHTPRGKGGAGRKRRKEEELREADGSKVKGEELPRSRLDVAVSEPGGAGAGASTRQRSQRVVRAAKQEGGSRFKAQLQPRAAGAGKKERGRTAGALLPGGDGVFRHTRSSTRAAEA